MGCAVLVTLVTTAGSAPDGRVRVLQMNLCNSGLAGCYTGRAVATAVDVIRAQTPDVVTLNEVCRADVAVLERARGVGARPRSGPRWTAAPARRCAAVDGEPYGIAVLTRRPATLTTGGIYPTQNPADPEQRAWLCLDTTDFAACTTHLDNGDAAVARAQCDYLLGTALPPRRGGPPRCWAGTSTCARASQGCLPRATGAPTTAACRTSW